MDTFKVAYTPMCQACKAVSSEYYVFVRFIDKNDKKHVYSVNRWSCEACFQALDNDPVDQRLERVITPLDARLYMFSEFYIFLKKKSQ